MSSKRTMTTGGAALLTVVAAFVIALALAGGASGRAAVTPGARAARHTACNEGPTRPCRFSDPDDTVRCLWTPSPNTVTCEL